MHKVFLTLPPILGYGNRIFVERNSELFAELKELSAWGGYDKVWNLSSGDWYGYEFMLSETLAKAIAACEKHGLTRISPEDFYKLPDSNQNDEFDRNEASVVLTDHS